MMLNFGHTHEIYQTTETEIGVWIDGSVIYRKVLPFTIGTYSTTIQTGVENIGTVVRMDGMSLTATDGYRSIPWVYGYGSATDQTWYIGAYCTPATGTLTIMAGSKHYGKTGFMILEYTKTV